MANTIGGSVSRIEPFIGRVVATVSLGRLVRGVAVDEDRAPHCRRFDTLAVGRVNDSGAGAS